MILTEDNPQDLDDRALAERFEAKRQRDLAQIPEQVRVLARSYIVAGGDPEVLIQAIASQ